MKESLEDMNCKDVFWKTPKEVLKNIKENDDELFEWLQDHELNTCDKCDMIESTYDLIWITAEDFEPKKKEVVPEWAYKKYDALCIECYKEILKENGMGKNNKTTKK